MSAAATSGTALLLYIEPTSYVAAQIAALRRAWAGRIELLFITENASQDWRISSADLAAGLLPSNRWAAAKSLVRTITKDRYRIVHLAGWGHPMLMLAMLIAWWRGIPSAVESDTFDDRATSPAKRLVKSVLYPTLFRLPRYFLPGGRNQSDYLSRYSVPMGRRRVAQMTVDVESIQAHIAEAGPEARQAVRRRLGIDPSAVAFLYVGRLEPYKGVGELLSAFKQLRQSSPAARLLVVGDGGMRGDVETAARHCSAIDALGRLTGKDLWDVYATADVLVLPSHREPWGLVVNEAMAAGLPVIVSDRVGCSNDLVVGRNSGLVFLAGSAAALEAALEELLADPEKRARMSVAAQRVMSAWTMAASARIITSTWSEVLTT